jgi:tetratricopeptide (TPR) repeat protein
MPTHDELQKLYDDAYEAMDRGDLREAARMFAELGGHDPKHAPFPYMEGLAHKYLRQWKQSLAANLRAAPLQEEPDQATHWNAAIAATALGDWAEARRQWAACGLGLPPGNGAIEMDAGVCSVRLNAWADGETVFAQRIDPARARLRNVPLPRSGYQFDDLVLTDGAAEGQREFRGHLVPVFNALERLAPSAYETFATFVRCPAEADLEALFALRVEGIGLIEDWTDSIRNLCLRCSHGVVHAHVDREPGAWEPERNLGIAARSEAAFDALMEAWLAGGDGRELQEAQFGVDDVPEVPEGCVWWRGPEEE